MFSWVEVCLIALAYQRPALLGFLEGLGSVSCNIMCSLDVKVMIKPRMLPSL